MYERLKGLGYDVFVYEKNAGASPESVLRVSLDEVEEADFFVAIFTDRLGDVTRQEFTHARKNGIPCFVFIKNHTDFAPDLRSFLETEIFPVIDGVGSTYFEFPLELATIIHESIQKYVRKKYREQEENKEELKNLRLQLEKINKEVSQSRETDSGF